MKIKLFYRLTLICFSLIFLRHINTKPVSLVAHAMGSINGFKYTNTIEAFEKNKPYFNTFEVDLRRLPDGEIICFHDKESILKLFRITNINIERKKDLEIIASDNNYQFCDIKKLFVLSEKNPNIKFIIDFKGKNKVLDLYKEIIVDNPKAKNFIIPQIYLDIEFNSIKNLGFEEIIFSFYRTPKTLKNDVLEKVLLNEYLFFALSKRELFSYVGLRLLLSNNQVYVHTINNRFLIYLMRMMGVEGIYTDKIQTI